MIRLSVDPKLPRHLMTAAGLAAIALIAVAQEGFPLDGTWRGSWTGKPNDGTSVVVIMKWDGERINGMVNPGPNSMELATAELDPSNWGVHLEAVNAEGVRIVFEGTLTDIGSYNRRIVGTWSEGDASSEFELVRE